MKRFTIYILAVAIAALLSGCGGSEDHVENQAYAVMLGVDFREGKIELTVRYPTLAGGSGASGQSGGSGYGNLSAVGKSAQEAVDALRERMPREINLSALTMIIVSDDVPAADRLGEVFDALYVNYRMYSSAYIAFCEGSAAEFVKKQEPVIGSRLSEALKATVGNAQALGVIPASRLADVYYRANSVYSDPLVMRCGPLTQAEKVEDGENGPTGIYLGASALDGYKTALDLTERQTLLAALLTGDIKKFSYTFGDSSAYVSVSKTPRISVDAGDVLRISIEIELEAMLSGGGGSVPEAAEALKAELVELLNMCRSAGVEPFGFADKAAADFVDLEAWKAYNWKKMFSGSEIYVDLRMDEIFKRGKA